MKYLIYILILVGLLLKLTPDCYAISDVSEDSLVVMGKLIDAQNGQFIANGIIEVNGNKYNIGQSSDFNITIPKETNLQISVKSIGYRPLLIKYTTNNSDNIDLEKVLMFQDSMTLINYTCRSWQLLCKYHRNRHSKGLDKHSKKERIKSNEIIAKYNYSFKSDYYQFQYNKRTDLIIIELY